MKNGPSLYVSLWCINVSGGPASANLLFYSVQSKPIHYVLWADKVSFEILIRKVKVHWRIASLSFRNVAQ